LHEKNYIQQHKKIKEKERVLTENPYLILKRNKRKQIWYLKYKAKKPNKMSSIK